ncbi:hypothetical protein ACTHOQ_03215 [Solibacillus silvestris]|uniref:hypothetical protein n=1 Tax=Solibacillus silvestris TaxID=76853 RepID=UPI003F7CE275
MDFSSDRSARVSVLIDRIKWNDVGMNSRVVYDFTFAEYGTIIALIPFSFYLIKKEKIETVKYMNCPLIIRHIQ